MNINTPKYKPRRLSKKAKERMARERAVRRENQQAREHEKRYGEGTFTFGYSAPRRGSDTSNIPSKMEIPKHKPREKTKLSKEMLERELEAQQEIERKKQCVAPAYNKGAYQYIGSREQAKDIGK